MRQCFDLDAFGFGHADQGPVCRGECVELSRRGKENAVCERDRRAGAVISARANVGPITRDLLIRTNVIRSPRAAP